MSNIKEQVSAIYDIELNNYMINKLYSQLNQKANSLGIKGNIYSPTKKENDYWEIYLSIAYVLAGVLIVIGGIAGFIYGWIDIDGIIIKLIGAVFHLILYAFFGAVIGVVVSFIVTLIVKKILDKREDKNFNDKMLLYNEKLKKDQIRIEKELIYKKHILLQMQILQSKYAQSKILLTQLYDISQIDKEFRNIICIGYINEYFKLKITEKLEGIDGAYYLLREDLKYLDIKGTLENITDKLDVVIDNQHRMYRELVTIQNREKNIRDLTLSVISKMNDTVKELSYNTAVTAYNTERIAKEEEYRTLFLLT